MNAITAPAVLVILLVGLFLTHFAFAAGSSGGGGSVGPSAQAKPLTPEQVAVNHYRAGVKHKKKAWKLEEKAAKARKEKKRNKLLGKAQKQYVKAVKRQSAALQANTRHHEAANELGYALRKTGDYKSALGAYNHALRLKPDFLQAVEYRGEAMLHLGQLDSSKQAYMRLFKEDQALASQLMQAMDEWLTSQDPSTTKVAEFSQWLTERKTLANFSQEAAANW